MRTHWIALASALALGACSSSEDAPPPAGWSGTLSGTIGGEAFTPADATGILMDPMPCAQLDGYPPGTHTIAEVQFSSASGVCGLDVDTACCGAKASALRGHFAITRTNVDGGPVEPIGPGTYDSSAQGVVDANGIVHHFWAQFEELDGTCASLGLASGGQGVIVFEEVGPSRIRGSVDIAFGEYATFSGTFDVPICGVADSVFCAALKGGCASNACVP